MDARWRRVRAARRRCAFGLDYFSRELKRALRFGLRESIAIGRSVAFDRKLIARPGSADRCDVSWRSSRPSASVALNKAHVAAASRSSCSGAASPRSAPSRHGRPQRYPPRPRLRGQEGRLQDVRARADAPRRRRDPRRGHRTRDGAQVQLLRGPRDVAAGHPRGGSGGHDQLQGHGDVRHGDVPPREGLHEDRGRGGGGPPRTRGDPGQLQGSIVRSLDRSTRETFFCGARDDISDPSSPPPLAR